MQPNSAQHPLPSLAMVLCVRDEERFLAANLAYHHALGVARVYVFLDRCTDRSLAIARSFPWVTVIEQDRDPADRYMSVYQVKCLNQALERARADGHSWLLHIDADEFACGDPRPPLVRQMTMLRRRSVQQLVKAGNLATMLAAIDPTIEQVVLRPREAVPVHLPAGAPFWKLHYMQTGAAVRRPLLDPITGEVKQLDILLGHDKGKSIVRTTADVQAASAHRWVRRDQIASDLVTAQRGFHYHFVVVDATQWRDKHRKFSQAPAYWEKGTPVRFPKQAWKEASTMLTDEQAAAYYQQWVAVGRWRLVGPALRGVVVYDPYVEHLLTQLPTFAQGVGHAP